MPQTPDGGWILDDDMVNPFETDPELKPIPDGLAESVGALAREIAADRMERQAAPLGPSVTPDAKPRRVKKTVVRDEHGRITHVIEEDLP